MLISVITTAFYMPPSWSMSVKFIPSHSIYLLSILVLFSLIYLGVPSGLIPSGFFTKNQKPSEHYNVEIGMQGRHKHNKYLIV